AADREEVTTAAGARPQAGAAGGHGDLHLHRGVAEPRHQRVVDGAAGQPDVGSGDPQVVPGYPAVTTFGLVLVVPKLAGRLVDGQVPAAGQPLRGFLALVRRCGGGGARGRAGPGGGPVSRLARPVRGALPVIVRG